MEEFFMIHRRKFIAITILSCFWSVASGVEASGSQATTEVGMGLYYPSSLISSQTASTSTEIGIGLYNPYATVTSTVAQADQSLKVEQGTWQSGKTPISFFDGALSLLPTVPSTEAMAVEVQSLSKPQNLPWKLKQISPVFSFNFADKTISAVNITLKYSGQENYYKQVYYYDDISENWKALPSTDFAKDKNIKALAKTGQFKVAVFANPSILTVGKASWYAYKAGMFCASPDFPKGSKLRVTNLDTGKSIEVVVNDWGPERDKHPDRVIDLSKEAFKALAPLSQGTMKVMISPINISPDSYGRVLGVKEEAQTNQPTLKAKSAIIINEDNGQVLLAKNANKVMPLASLTKILAVSVYLTEQPDLNRKVTYKDKDAQFNTLYVPAYESAKINLKNGDTLIAKDLVYASLVASANNAVESLVRESGLSREKFIEKMNQTAKDWGAGNSHFVEPTGLSAKNVTTVEDYAVITKMAFKNDVIRQASTAASYKVAVKNRKVSITIKNTNKLVLDQAQENLKMTDLGINGSKTGYLNEAGYCLMTRVKSTNGRFIIVTMGAPTRATSFNEMMDLIKYANLKS